MPEYRALSPIKDEGTIYNPGETLVLNQDAAAELVKLGAVELLVKPFEKQNGGL
jgi:hypothetical protein